MLFFIIVLLTAVTPIFLRAMDIISNKGQLTFLAGTFFIWAINIDYESMLSIAPFDTGVFFAYGIPILLILWAGNLASATSSFTSALKSIPTSTLKDAGITSADITDIGSLITSFGDIYLDFYREQILEQVVPKAEPIVTKLCTLFANDFDKRSPMFAAIYSGDIHDVIRFTEDTLKKQPENLQARAILLPIYQQTMALQTQTAASFASLNTAAKSCVKTSITFANSISDPTISLNDIVDFATKAQTAYNAVMATIKQK
jgi:hypothetical protein